MRHLGHVLHRTRLLDLQGHADDHEVGDKNQKDKQLHRNGRRNRRFRVYRMHMHRAQQRVGRPSEMRVQKLGKSRLYRHKGEAG